MNLEITKGGRYGLVHLLPTCGGTDNIVMVKAAEYLKCNTSEDFVDALGPFGRCLTEKEAELPVRELRPIEEIAETAKQTTGKVDLASVILHFSGAEHFRKFQTVPTIVGREIPEELRAFAHTLLPLTVVGGRYYYDNGVANVEIRGLVQFGPSNGSPYAHLAGLVWLPDGGLSARVLAAQAACGIPENVVGVTLLDYNKTPRLQKATVAAKEALGL